MTAVQTAVFPVAGLGTRFLPATKSIPKELLPIVDRPLVQYAVDEARAAGIENLVFVTGRGKGAIEDHFDVSYELEATLRSRGKVEELEELKRLRPKPGQVAYVRQMEPLGLGHAVWCARNLIGNQPFALLLADELIVSDHPPLAEMIELHEQHGGNVVLVDEVPDEATSMYGIIDPGVETENAISVTSVIEKPDIADAPSNLAIIGRYILDPSIMNVLGETERGAGGEIQLTDALLTSIGSTPFHALRMDGERYDCGSKLGFIEATLQLALRRDDLGPSVQKMIERLAHGQE